MQTGVETENVCSGLLWRFQEKLLFLNACKPAQLGNLNTQKITRNAHTGLAELSA